MGEHGNYTAQRSADFGFEIFSDMMRIVYRPRARDEDMHGNESTCGCLTGTQSVEVNASSPVSFHDCFDQRLLLFGECCIHQSHH